MKKLIGLFCTVLLMTGCAALSPTPEERARRDKERTQRTAAIARMPIATTLTATEATEYQEVGSDICETSDDPKYSLFSTGTMDDYCRRSLKDSAYEKNGNLVVIESNETYKCDSVYKPGSKFNCIRMKARFYRKIESQ